MDLTGMDFGAAETIREWLFGLSAKVLFWWEGEQTYYCVVVQNGTLLFLRVFRLGENWVLSQDKRIPLYEPDTERYVDGMPMYSATA